MIFYFEGMQPPHLPDHVAMAIESIRLTGEDIQAIGRHIARNPTDPALWDALYARLEGCRDIADQTRKELRK